MNEQPEEQSERLESKPDLCDNEHAGAVLDDSIESDYLKDSQKDTGVNKEEGNEECKQIGNRNESADDDEACPLQRPLLCSLDRGNHIKMLSLAKIIKLETHAIMKMLSRLPQSRFSGV